MLQATAGSSDDRHCSGKTRALPAGMKETAGREHGTGGQAGERERRREKKRHSRALV